MLRLKAVFHLIFSPLLLIAILFGSFMMTQDLLISSLTMGIVLFRLSRMRNTLYSEQNHWILALLIGAGLYLYKQTFDLRPLTQCILLSILIATMFHYALFPRSRINNRMKELKKFTDIKQWEIGANHIKIVFIDKTSSVIATGGLRTQEIEWISYRLILRDSKLKTYTTRVIVEETLGRCERIILSR